MGGTEAQKRIQYTKPEAVDIGGVAPVVGQSCAIGSSFGAPRHWCDTGNGNVKQCKVGLGAASCTSGQVPV